MPCRTTFLSQSLLLCRRLSAGGNRKVGQRSSWSCVPKVWIKETQGAKGRGQKSQSLAETTGNGALHSLGGWGEGQAQEVPTAMRGEQGGEGLGLDGACGDLVPQGWAEGAVCCGRPGRACGTYRQSGRSRVLFSCCVKYKTLKNNTTTRGTDPRQPRGRRRFSELQKSCVRGARRGAGV